MIFIRTDILNPYKREIVSQNSYDTLIKFLIDIFPSGFDRPVDISVNGFTIPMDDWDIELQDDDIVVLLDRQGVPLAAVGGSWFLAALANLAISVTLSYVVNKLFAPDAPEAQDQPSSVYTLNSAQNMSRFGDPIPIVYGTVRMYPAMIVQPYYKFEDNIEYLYHVLCIGQGKNTTDNVQIAEDTITSVGDLQWKLLYQDSFYNIPANAYGIHITRTLSSPSNLELKEGVLTEEYTIKQGTQSVEFDYHYPNGLYSTKTSGDYDYGIGAFTYYIRSSTGTLLTSGRAEDAGISADPIQKTVAVNVGTWTVSDTITISFQQEVTVDNPGYSEKNYIRRIKEIYPNEDFTQLYGDITLLACKIRSSDAVSSAGQVKVNGYFTRTDVGNTMAEVVTDIYSNTNYGGGLDTQYLDFPTTTEEVNGAYDSNMTIFDAMRRPCLAQKYSLYLAGMDVILKKDAPNNVTSGMYNEMNILRNSIKVQYLFKEENPSYDSFETQYIDEDWIPQTYRHPTWGSRPQQVDLFGVAGDGSEVIAQEMAEYLFNQDDYRRKIVTFNTDIQGLVPQYLDKIMISHSALQWGEAGEVYSRSGDNIELSDVLIDTSSGQTIVFRNIDGALSYPYDIIIIDEYNVTVSGMPVWVTNNMFYTIQNKDTAKEFLVISVKPSGDTVQIECVNYNDEIY